MTRTSQPIIQCDADGFCGAWEVDHYETGASSVGGTRITGQNRAPGWVSVGDADYCPEHKGEAVIRDE